MDVGDPGADYYGVIVDAEGQLIVWQMTRRWDKPGQYEAIEEITGHRRQLVLASSQIVYNPTTRGGYGHVEIGQLRFGVSFTADAYHQVMNYRRGLWLRSIRPLYQPQKPLWHWKFADVVRWRRSAEQRSYEIWRRYFLSWWPS